MIEKYKMRNTNLMKGLIRGDLKRIIDQSIKEFEIRTNKKYGILLTETLRSRGRQQELYAQGRTEKGKIVTNCDGVEVKSMHQLGLAFDFVVIKNEDNSAIWGDLELYRLATDIIKEFAKKECILRFLNFGIDWKNFKDIYHVEVKKGFEHAYNEYGTRTDIETKKQYYNKPKNEKGDN